jgi:hypothetical protein
MLRYITVFSLTVFMASAATLPIDLTFGAGGGKIAVDGTTHILSFSNAALTPSQILDTVIKGGPLADYGCDSGGTPCYMSHPTTSLEVNISNGTALGWTLGNPATGNSRSLTPVDLVGEGFLDIVDPAGTLGADIKLGLQLVNIATTGSGASTNTALQANLTYISTTGTSALAGWNLLNSSLMASTAGAYATQTFIFSGSIDDLYNSGSAAIGYTSHLVVAPEPAFYGLLGLGMSGLFAISFRRKKSVS